MVFEDVFSTIQTHHPGAHCAVAFTKFYGQISIIIPYVDRRARLLFAKKVSFGVFNQAADAFGNVNTAMNFFVDRYVGLADFSATVDRLTSFDEAFVRALARAQRICRGRRPAPRPARRSPCPSSSSPCRTAASWRGSAI